MRTAFKVATELTEAAARATAFTPAAAAAGTAAKTQFWQLSKKTPFRAALVIVIAIASLGLSAGTAPAATSRPMPTRPSNHTELASWKEDMSNYKSTKQPEFCESKIPFSQPALKRTLLSKGSGARATHYGNTHWSGYVDTHGFYTASARAGTRPGSAPAAAPALPMRSPGSASAACWTSPKPT
jgi:hypothetical protein